MKNKILKISFLIFITQLSCSRAIRETNVTFKILEDSMSLKSETEVEPLWAPGQTVTALSDINCYSVMVGSLDGDASLNRNTRLVSNGTLSYPSSCRLTFGPIFGNFPLVKNTLNAEVTEFVVNLPSGPDRVITLIGTKVTDPSFCFDMAKALPDETKFSERYIIGQIRISLEQGKDRAIQITKSWSASSKWVRDLSGDNYTVCPAP